ncbi:unnamed protein product, partial [Nesidiocoris tenuis]
MIDLRQKTLWYRRFERPPRRLVRRTESTQQSASSSPPPLLARAPPPPPCRPSRCRFQRFARPALPLRSRPTVSPRRAAEGAASPRRPAGLPCVVGRPSQPPPLIARTQQGTFAAPCRRPPPRRSYAARPSPVPSSGPSCPRPAALARRRRAARKHLTHAQTCLGLEQLEELLVSDGEGPRPDSSTSSPGDENNNPCRSASASVGVGNGIGVNRADCMTRCASTPGYTAPTGVVGPQMTPCPTSLPKPKPKSPVETSTPASTSANPVSVLQSEPLSVACADVAKFRHFRTRYPVRWTCRPCRPSSNAQINCEADHFPDLCENKGQSQRPRAQRIDSTNRATDCCFQK